MSRLVAAADMHPTNTHVIKKSHFQTDETDEKLKTT